MTSVALPGCRPDRRRLLIAAACALALILWNAPTALGGPPFKTDDPEPVPWRHYEAYLFTTCDHGVDSTSWALPAVEFNLGAAPGLQLHVVVPTAYLSPQNAYGLGDVELGAKYRFLRETARRPQVGVFPLVELPTGHADRGLGNGQLWALLPVWVQKSSGRWTTYGGAGYEINHAPGMKDSLFAGWLVQRAVSTRLVLGGEVFHQEAQEIGGRQATFLDGGGYYNFREDLSLLFMLGHTVSGESRTAAYLGLYYTWGRAGPSVTGDGGSARAGSSWNGRGGSWVGPPPGTGDARGLR